MLVEERGDLASQPRSPGTWHPLTIHLRRPSNREIDRLGEEEEGGEGGEEEKEREKEKEAQSCCKSMRQIPLNHNSRTYSNSNMLDRLYPRL